MKDMFYILGPIVATIMFIFFLMTCNVHKDEEPIEIRHRQEIIVEERENG